MRHAPDWIHRLKQRGRGLFHLSDWGTRQTWRACAPPERASRGTARRSLRGRRAVRG